METLTSSRLSRSKSASSKSKSASSKSKSASSSLKSNRFNSGKWAKQMNIKYSILVNYKRKSHQIKLSMADPLIKQVSQYFGKENYTKYELFDESNPHNKIVSYSTLADFYSEDQLDKVRLKFQKKQNFLRKIFSRKGGLSKKRNQTFRKTKRIR